MVPMLTQHWLFLVISITDFRKKLVTEIRGTAKLGELGKTATLHAERIMITIGDTS